MKSLMAFVAAPLPVSTAAIVWAIINKNPIHWAAIFVIVTGMLYAAQLVPGIPMHMVLRRFCKTRVFEYVVCGFLLLPLTFLPLFLWSWEKNGYTIQNTWSAFALLAAVGGSTSATFWLIRRPDRIG